jgi:phosphate transport system permease protein
MPQVPRWRAGTPTALSRFGNLAFHRICQAAAISVLVLAALLLIVLCWKSWLAMSTIGPRFFVDDNWDPEPTHRQFGALAFVYGTLATSALAMLMAVPLGVGTAAFLSEIAPAWLRRAGSFLVEMLAAIPSVVYGFWGIAVLAPVLQEILTFLGGPNQGGKGIVPAGLILAIMVVPYVAAVSFDVCRAVPRTQREGSLALGATRWQTIWSVVLPYARPGIIGGCFLALGRALGETMAVTMLIGNRPDIPDFMKPFSEFISQVFLGKGNSIPSVIANEFTEATYDLYLSALIELGFVLLLVNIVVNVFARLLIWRVGKTGRRTSLLSRFHPKRNEERLKVPTRPAKETDNRAPSHDRIATRRSVFAAKVVNVIMTCVLGLCLAVTVGFLLLILAYLVIKGISALDLDFFTKLPKPVGEKGGGLANAIYGSGLLVGLATLFAVPIGLLAAIFLVEYRSDRLGPTVRFVGELLGGVPSIVIGIFAYSLIVVPMHHFSAWAGSFALGVMMIPIVMRASEEALRLVPKSLRQASFALGANHAQMVLRVSVPAALPAIITAVFLAIARVAGETAPLIMTAFSNTFWPRSPNEATPSLPYYIFQYAMGPYPEWHRQAWAAALVLLVFVMVLNFGIRVVTGKRLVSAAGAD